MFKAWDMVQYSSDPAFAVDEELRVTAWNTAAEELLGYPVSDAIGLRCSSILQALYPTGEKLCSAMCRGGSCFSLGEKWGIEECQLRHMNGDMLPAGISSVTLPPEARTDEDRTVAIIFMRKAYDRLAGVKPERRMRVFTLGRFGLAFNGKGLSVETWNRRKAAVVLKILLGNLNIPVHREQLIEWIWPDTDPVKGWQRLKVTISSLRNELRKAGVNPEIIETVGLSYVLREQTVCVDSAVFCDLVVRGQDAMKGGNLTRAQVHFEEARALYQGDLFEDEPYAEWCSVERERLREIHLELLSSMATCYSGAGNHLAASQVCRMALSTDPCRESFVRMLMECFDKMGRPDWARAQFLSWQRVLGSEYGLEPTSATFSVYGRITQKRVEPRRKTA